MVPCAGPVFAEFHTFLHVCICFFRGETALQLLEVIIHYGEIKLLRGGRLLPLLRERLEDILHRLAA